MKATRLLSVLLFVLAFTAVTHGVQANKLEKLELKLELICNFGEALERGNYDWIHKGYREAEVPKADCEKGQKVKVGFFKTHEKITPLKDLLEEMKRANCQAATWPYLMAIGAQYPEMQHNMHIVALGSVWWYTPKTGPLQGLTMELVSSLYTDEDGRDLGFDYALGWPEDIYFIAVCRE